MRARVLKAVTKTVLREHLRTPEAVFWTYGFPLLMALVLGFGLGDGSREPVRIVVVAAGSPVLGETLAGAAYGRLAVEFAAATDAQRALTLGEVDLVVSGSIDAPVVQVDPHRSGSELAQLLVERALRTARGELPALDVRVHEVDEPGDRYIDFLIAGLIGMNLLGAGMYGIGYNVVQMRGNKLLRRLAVTPMQRAAFLFACRASRTLLAVPPSAVLLAFGWFVFGVPVRGSWLVLGGLILLGALTFAGLGLLVASRTRSTETVSDSRRAGRVRRRSGPRAG